MYMHRNCILHKLIVDLEAQPVTPAVLDKIIVEPLQKVLHVKPCELVLKESCRLKNTQFRSFPVLNHSYALKAVITLLSRIEHAVPV